MKCKLSGMFRIGFGLSAWLALMPAAARATDIFVANAGNNSIGEYTMSGTTVNASLVSGLSGPLGIAVSGSDIFVTNVNRGTIGEYTTSGATVNDALVTGLNRPYGIAVSGSDLFVTNNVTGGTIGEYTTSGATVNASLISGLTDPTAIALAGSDLFVGNNGNSSSGTVGEYTASGGVVNATLVSRSLLESLEPDGVAVAGSELLVSNSANGTVGEYTTSGATVNSSLISVFLPAGITLFGSDLFLAIPTLNNNGGNTGTIGEYTTSGAVVDASLISGLDGPFDVAVGNGAAVAPVVPIPPAAWTSFVMLGVLLVIGTIRSPRLGDWGIELADERPSSTHT